MAPLTPPPPPAIMTIAGGGRMEALSLREMSAAVPTPPPRTLKAEPRGAEGPLPLPVAPSSLLCWLALAL